MWAISRDDDDHRHNATHFICWIMRTCVQLFARNNNRCSILSFRNELWFKVIEHYALSAYKCIWCYLSKFIQFAIAVMCVLFYLLFNQLLYHHICIYLIIKIFYHKTNFAQIHVNVAVFSQRIINCLRHYTSQRSNLKLITVW